MQELSNYFPEYCSENVTWKTYTPIHSWNIEAKKEIAPACSLKLNPNKDEVGSRFPFCGSSY